jgi:hypothetical protein
MAPIVTSAEIDRPAADVFTYATDPSRFSEWQQGVVEGHMSTDAPVVGAKCVTTRRIGGSNRPSTSELRPLVEIARRWHVSHAAAAKCVKGARERGYLGWPARKGLAGYEATRPGSGDDRRSGGSSLPR